jgi:NADPH:quinone reductase-like Zn-dependent oxidoreductase
MEVDYVVGYVHEVGEGVTRFKKGDRVLSMSAVALRNDHRFGAHQRYTLSVETLTAHVRRPLLSRQRNC